MKKKSLLLISFIFIAIFSLLIIRPLTNLDELWNYNVARCIQDGLIPYKDISMVSTPLHPMLIAIFLKIITNQVIVTRVLNAIVWTGIFYTIYKILVKLINEENICLIITAILGTIISKNIVYLDYNALVLCFALIILYQELKKVEKSKKLLETSIRYNVLIRNASRVSNMY